MTRVVNVMLVVITVVSFFWGFYSWELSQRERVPTFLQDKIAVKIVSAELTPLAPIKIVGSDGEQILGNVYSSKFYFFNQGSEPIKRENVLDSIKISLDDTSAVILDFKLVKVSRNICGLALTSDSTRKFLRVSFDILERNDGCVGQIIYRSNGNPKLTISGVIEGSGETFKNIVTTKFQLTFFSIGLVVVTLFLGTLIYYIFFPPKQLRMDEKYDSPKQTFKSWLTTKYRLLIRSESNYFEQESIVFTYAQVIGVSMLLSFSLFFMSAGMQRIIERQQSVMELPDSLK